MSTIEELREFLRIDKNRLDDCLIEQPDVYYKVSEALMRANADRDTIKLHLEEKTAIEDQRLREAAARREERMTETSIQQQLRLVPALKELNEKLAEQRFQCERWSALKEAFQQRSFMLRELVAVVIAQARDLGVEAGAGQARNDLAERNREAAGRLRRQRLERG